jgi:hypothetical protein
LKSGVFTSGSNLGHGYCLKLRRKRLLCCHLGLDHKQFLPKNGHARQTAGQKTRRKYTRRACFLGQDLQPLLTEPAAC